MTRHTHELTVSIVSRRWVRRQKKVVGDTFHGVGLVVPIKDGVGYRPLPYSKAELKDVFKGLDDQAVSAKLDWKFLDEMSVLVTLANDECDPGKLKNEQKKKKEPKRTERSTLHTHVFSSAFPHAFPTRTRPSPPGMGLELGLNMFSCRQHRVLQRATYTMLSLAYELLNRQVFARIAKSAVRYRYRAKVSQL